MLKFLWETETRGRAYADCEDLRSLLGGSRLVGHAAVFNSLSEDLGGWREKIAPGTFAESIKTSDIRALFNHNPEKILGRNTAGTLKLSEDNVGLLAEYDIPDTTDGRDLLVSVKRGDITQQSFGFVVLPGGAKWQMEDGGLVRTLTNVELFDVSPVTYPAYPTTDIAARAAHFLPELRTIAGQKLKELKVDPEIPEKVIAEALAKRQAREAFLAARTPKPDPDSIAEIIRHARI